MNCTRPKLLKQQPLPTASAASVPTTSSLTRRWTFDPALVQRVMDGFTAVPTEHISRVTHESLTVGDNLTARGVVITTSTHPASVTINLNRLTGPYDDVIALMSIPVTEPLASLQLGSWTYYNLVTGDIGQITQIAGPEGRMGIAENITLIGRPVAGTQLEVDAQTFEDIRNWGRDELDEETRRELMNPSVGVDHATGEDRTVIFHSAGPVAGVPNRNGDVYAESALSDAQALNEALFEQLSGTNSAEAQAAVDAVNDFTRARMREDGFMRRILPPLQISNDELDRQVEESPEALSIPFASLPTDQYIRGERYRVTFDRIVTPNFSRTEHAVMTQHEDWATPDERAEWAIWLPKRRCYLAIENNTVTWGNTVPKLRFPDRFSAMQFRPDLQEHHKAEVVQVTNMWYEIEATVEYEDADGPKQFKHNRLYTFDGETSFWMDPDRDNEHKAMRFSSAEQAMAIWNMVAAMPARGLHRSKPGRPIEQQMLPCHTIKYRLPQPEVKINDDYHKPLRAIQLKD